MGPPHLRRIPLQTLKTNRATNRGSHPPPGAVFRALAENPPGTVAQASKPAVSQVSKPAHAGTFPRARVGRRLAELSVFAKVGAVRTRASVSLPSVRNGGVGRGEEALRHGEIVRSSGAPLSPTLSPFVPHGARETDALLVAAVPAHTFATIDRSRRYSRWGNPRYREGRTPLRKSGLDIEAPDIRRNRMHH